MVVIITIVSVSALLNGMEFIKVKKTKSKQSSKKLPRSTQDSNTLDTNSSETYISSANSGKLPVKNLNDLKDMKRVQNEYRDKACMSKSEQSLDKK